MKRVPDKSWKESMAYAPRFFLSMLFTLLAFAVVSYIATGSIVTALIQTVICAVLIQIGYFLVMLYLVWRTAKARQTFADSFLEGHACRVCPPVELPADLLPAERARRAEALRRGHYARVALASAHARSKKKAAPVQP